MSLTRLLLTWLLLAVLMPLNGALREFGFKRLMPDAAAEVLSVATGIAIILATTRWLFRIPAVAATGTLAGYSLVLVGLTVAYEFGIGRAGGKSWAELLGNYAIWDGKLWPLVLVALACTPWLWRGR
jgi:hypothetical protein